MVFPHSIKQNLTRLLGNQTAILNFEPMDGGCINEGGRLITTAGTYFIKWNNRWTYPDMLTMESRGLILLANTKSITIPKVIHTAETNDIQYLLLEFIDSAPPSFTFWKTFGEQLATLHQSTYTHFGLEHDNYMGSLKQSNAFTNNWFDFFIQERLNPQLVMAVNAGKLPSALIKKFDNLYTKLNYILPAEMPALVHGDLWSGNLLCGGNGPVLIDPAVHYGNREADLAMTQLFGGFESIYFDAYQQIFPLSPGFSERYAIYNLYPLLIHVNLFGGGYASQVTTIISRFS